MINQSLRSFDSPDEKDKAKTIPETSLQPTLPSFTYTEVLPEVEVEVIPE